MSYNSGSESADKISVVVASENSLKARSEIIVSIVSTVSNPPHPKLLNGRSALAGKGRPGPATAHVTRRGPADSST